MSESDAERAARYFDFAAMAGAIDRTGPATFRVTRGGLIVAASVLAALASNLGDSPMKLPFAIVFSTLTHLAETYREPA
jgi:hypothetical protein